MVCMRPCCCRWKAGAQLLPSLFVYGPAFDSGSERNYESSWSGISPLNRTHYLAGSSSCLEKWICLINSYWVGFKGLDFCSPSSRLISTCVRCCRYCDYPVIINYSTCNLSGRYSYLWIIICIYVYCRKLAIDRVPSESWRWTETMSEEEE